MSSAARMRAGFAGPGSVIRPGGTGMKSEPPIIGLVADKDDEAHACALRSLERFRDQRAAEALPRDVGSHDERSQQQRPARTADRDLGELDGRDDPFPDHGQSAIGRDEACAGRAPLSHTISGAREAAGPERLSMEIGDRG